MKKSKKRKSRYTVKSLLEKVERIASENRVKLETQQQEHLKVLRGAISESLSEGRKWKNFEYEREIARLKQISLEKQSLIDAMWSKSPKDHVVEYIKAVFERVWRR